MPSTGATCPSWNRAPALHPHGIEPDTALIDVGGATSPLARALHVTRERPFVDLPEDTFYRWINETPEENQADFDAIVAAGAFVMGRRMFGPVTGERTGDWRGW